MKTTFASVLAVMLGAGCASSPTESKSPDSTEASPPETVSEWAEHPEGLGSEEGNNEPANAGVERLEVPILSRSGSTLAGKAELTETEHGVKIVVRVDNAEPGLHGVHIHQRANCSAPDASSAGDHFNPENMPHGLPPDDSRHLGDLGNLHVVPPGGKGELEIVVPDATLKAGEPFSFLNRALIVHSNQDTGEQPSGSSGDRVGCAELTHSAGQKQAMGKAGAQ